MVYTKNKKETHLRALSKLKGLKQKGETEL